MSVSCLVGELSRVLITLGSVPAFCYQNAPVPVNMNPGQVGLGSTRSGQVGLVYKIILCNENTSL